MSDKSEFAQAVENLGKKIKDKKPPLGLMSKTFWEERRILNIIEAIDRYIGAGKSIPRDWVDEFNDLIQKRVDK